MTGPTVESNFSSGLSPSGTITSHGIRQALKSKGPRYPSIAQHQPFREQYLVNTRGASRLMLLHEAGGRFPVGATTFKLTVLRHPVSNVKVRSGTSSSELKHALALEEVAFTAYYPADVPLKSIPRGIHWLLHPLRASLQGYSNYSGDSPSLKPLFTKFPDHPVCSPLGLSIWILWPVVYLFGTLLKIPVHPDAPLLNPHDATQPKHSKSSPWPLVIFSHGLGGSRTAYSQLCTRIASSGRVVLAMEHRDGSGHAVMPGFSDPVPYIKETSLVWPPDYPAEQRNMLSFRGEQLSFRRMEIYYALRAIQDLVRDGHSGTRSSLETVGGCIDWSRWSTVEAGKPIECEENVVLAGHSFGGATILSILSNAPPDNEPLMPIRKALIFDPWLEPLPSPGPIPHWRFKEGHAPRILVMNSEGFTLWKDHFTRLMEVGKSWTEDRWELLTIVGSKHISFSDFPILPLMSTKAARLILDKILHISLVFLDNNGNDTTAGMSTRELETKVIGRRADGRPKRRIVGNLCDVVLH